MAKLPSEHVVDVVFSFKVLALGCVAMFLSGLSGVLLGAWLVA